VFLRFGIDIGIESEFVQPDSGPSASL
jgi:hypothetical protein